MSQEPLQELPLGRWCELKSAFKNDWPRGVSGFAVLDTQERWFENGIKYDFKVYCPYGDVKNGMVAVNENNPFYSIIIQCPGDDTEKLGEALKTTKIIDWQTIHILPFAPDNIIECFKKIGDDIQMEIRFTIPSETFILDTKTPFKDVDIPENATVEIITNDYLDLVDSTWPHRHPSSSLLFKELIGLKLGYGLFVNKNLVSWVFTNESGNLLHMYTVEEYRKKGYGELILKIVCNVLIKDGRVVTAYCVKDNVNALNLYKKTGFVLGTGVAWCFVNSKIK